MRFFRGFLLVLLVFGNAIAGTCPSGFDDVTTKYPTTFYAKNLDGLCPAGYESYTAPSTFDFTFNGLVLGTAPTVCDSDSHYENGTCVQNTPENCDSGFYRNSVNGATFYSKNKDNLCPTGYEAYTYGNNMTFIFNGLILSSAPTVCATGHYVNGSCAAYDTDGCISGYIDVGSDGVIASVDANGACPSNYTALGSYQSCNPTTTDNICTTLCNGGLLRTALGYCSEVCPLGLPEMHIGPGVSIAVYGTQTTVPTLKISDGVDVCYVNIAPGVGSGTLNLSDGTHTYHVTN